MARTFPRTSPRMGRRLGRRTPWVLMALAASLGLVVPASLPGAQADDLHHKQHQVRKHIAAAAQELDDTSAALRRALARLGSARAQLLQARRQYAATRAQLARAIAADTVVRQRLVEAQAQLQQAQVDLANGRAQVAEQRDDIGRMAAADYALGDPGLLKLDAVFNTQDPTDLSYQLNAVNGLMTREHTTLQTLTELRDRLQAQEEKVAAYQRTVAQRRQETLANVARRQAIAAAARVQQQRVSGLFLRTRAIARQARAQREADVQRLRSLRAQEDRIAEAIRRRAAMQHGGYTGHSNGFLTRPVPGWVTSPFGWRKHPIYGYWGLHNGVDFHAPCGTPMVAAASGEVIEKFYSSVYGNRLYIDLGPVNGKNLTIVYNHATSYTVGLHQHVRRGEVIGYSGTTGWSTACHLHFITMVNGTPVNPMQFL